MKSFTVAVPIELTVEKFDTPYVGIVIRTLANPEDAADLAIAHKLQDQIQITAGSDEAIRSAELRQSQL